MCNVFTLSIDYYAKVEEYIAELVILGVLERKRNISQENEKQQHATCCFTVNAARLLQQDCHSIHLDMVNNWIGCPFTAIAGLLVALLVAPRTEVVNS